MSDSVSISNKISQEKKSLERLFALIGEAVYKENPDSPMDGLEDEWAAVKVAYSNIAAYTEQLNHIKGIVYCPNCGRPAANGDKFCARCGLRLDNRPETTGTKMVKDLKEAGQEVGRIAGDAADRTGEAGGGAAAGTRNAFSWLKGRFGKPKKEDGTQTPEAEKEAAAEEAEARSDDEAVVVTGTGSVPEAGARAHDAADDAGTAQEAGAEPYDAAIDAGAVQEAGAEPYDAAGTAPEAGAESYDTVTYAGSVQEAGARTHDADTDRGTEICGT